MTSASPVPANLVNTGTVLNASSPKVESIVANNGTFVLSIQSYAGHNYQFERSPTLAQKFLGSGGQCAIRHGRHSRLHRSLTNGRQRLLPHHAFAVKLSLAVGVEA